MQLSSAYGDSFGSKCMVARTPRTVWGSTYLQRTKRKNRAFEGERGVAREAGGEPGGSRAPGSVDRKAG